MIGFLFGQQRRFKMSEEQWEQFFDLLIEIENLPGLTYKEKKELLEEKAEKYGAAISLEEVTNWFNE